MGAGAGVGPARATGRAQAVAAAAAGPTPLPSVIGWPESDIVEPEDTLLDVAARHRLGFDAVARLNPEINVWIPDPGTVVRLPTQYVLPEGRQRGLVINIPEMRLYDFTSRSGPEVFAIAIGDEIDPSLMGEFRVGGKRVNPAWNVPASIRAEKPELPAVVPPGPDNPLGDRWMTIGNTSYGIHGTNNQWSIGRTATHGCIRLYNDEMLRLFDRIPTGTPIRLQYQPVKLGQIGDGIYAEAHPDVYLREPDPGAFALRRLEELGLSSYVDWRALARVIEESRGVPVRVGTIPDAPVSTQGAAPTYGSAS
jgi:L,D-transpeptidase ErfK/SrfK